MDILIGEINESSAGTVTAAFADADGTPVTPTNVYYRIDCVTTGIAVKALTQFTPPGTSIEITLDPDDNAIQSAANATETKEITIIADKDLDTQSVQTAQWRVKNAAYF